MHSEPQLKGNHIMTTINNAKQIAIILQTLVAEQSAGARQLHNMLDIKSPRLRPHAELLEMCLTAQKQSAQTHKLIAGLI